MTIKEAPVRTTVLAGRARLYLISIAPGFVFSALVAAAATSVAVVVTPMLPMPAMVCALLIGVALNPIAAKPVMQVGIRFCIKTLLRCAVALLGLRIALYDIAALGLTNAILIVFAMSLTIWAAFAFARWNGQSAGFGAISGAAVAICGASAALAASSVVPNYPGKQTDLAFVVIAANALATVGMVLYPPMCVLLNLDPITTGVLLGGTIHDVAQVVGAGYAVSDTVGNAAVIVKLFRVLLLFPFVMIMGWYSWRTNAGHAKVPIPIFAIVFLVLCLVNSGIQLLPRFIPVYAFIKLVFVELSAWGLLVAIAALGLSTSVSAIARLGWQHIASMVFCTILLAAVVTAGLVFLQPA